MLLLYLLIANVLKEIGILILLFWLGEIQFTKFKG